MNDYDEDPELYDQDEAPHYDLDRDRYVPETLDDYGWNEVNEDQDEAPHYDLDLGDRYGPETAAQLQRQTQRALQNEEFLRWEHELGQPNYYNYFLEEMTR